MDPSVRFARKYEIAPSGCWLWNGTTNRDGYGSFWNGERRPRATGRATPVMVLAHRWSYEHFVGPIPSRLYVLHSCDTPGCVNPDHLFVGTQADNVRDCAAKGRRNQRRARKPPRSCAVEGCDGVAVTRGWCMRHYTRWRRHGSTHLPSKETG